MSADKIVLALDGMGGDRAPEVVVNGADIARERYPGTSFLLFGDPARLKPLAVSKNHIYWRGGNLRFGKLAMRATDLELIDNDAKDPFDFSVAHYNDMLVAGYSKNLPRLGLRTYMPDYNDIKAGRAARAGAEPVAGASK